MPFPQNRAASKPRTFLTVCLVLCGLTGAAFSQAPGKAAQAAKPLDLASVEGRAAAVAELAAKAKRAKDAAVLEAKAKGWPIRGNKDGRGFELRRLDEHGLPIYNITTNVNAAISTGASLIRNTAPYSLNGSGFRAGVWDEGSVRTTHQEFPGRAFSLDGAAAADHSTHCGGTIGAAGTAAAALGMAPSVRLDSYDWNSDTAEMAAAAATTAVHTGKVTISNHSYGFISGWYGTDYYGNYPEREDAKFGQYGSDANEWDSICVSAPYYLPFKAAGNDRSDGAPAAGSTFRYLSGGNWVSKTYSASTDPYSDGWDNGGFDTMDTVGSAKNIMTIGAANDAVSGGVRSVANGTMSSFSGWGPTDDGRIKPDLVANGVNLYSSVATGDTAYATYSGTSMATPNAVGSALLLQQLYAASFPGAIMRASTLKALLLHTADDTGNPGPDYVYGWGYMNVKKAADHILSHRDAPTAQFITAAQLDTAGPVDTYTFVWDGAAPIRATLCWTDPAGAAKTTLDNRTRVLVNDLDLRITKSGTTYFPYVLDVNNPATNATAGDNITDNVEQVLIAAPTAGTYTLTVAHKGTLSGGAQTYSLIIGGQAVVLAPLIIAQTSAVSSETGVPANGAVDPGETVTVALTLKNTGSLTTTNLQATLAATGGVTLPGTAQTYGAVAVGASVARPFIFTAAGVCGGTVTATLNLTDGATNLGSVTFTFQLGLTGPPATTTFSNTASISIPNSGTASPYPSNITVSGIGSVTKVTATLTGLTHTWPDDLDVLLVGPGGQSAMLMSAAGGSANVNGVNLTFDATAASLLPGNTQITAGTYQPSHYNTAVSLASPAPAGPYGALLSVFNGIAANGTWKLFVNDHDNGDSGSVSGGWSVSVTASTPLCTDTSANLSVTAGGYPSPVAGGQNLAFEFTVENLGPSHAAGVALACPLPGGATFVSATSTLGSCTQAGSTVTANIGTLSNGAKATVKIVVSTAPAFGGSLACTATASSNQADPAAGNNSQTAAVTVQADSDGDGLPDAFETLYFGNATGGNPTLDADGDGLTNLHEFQAGTNPADANSSLRVSAFTLSGGAAHVTFGSVSGRRYQVEGRDSLLTGQWTTLWDNIIGTGAPIIFDDAGATGLPARFYRLKTLQP